MKVAIFTDTYFPKIDGIARSVQQFVTLLSEKGHRFVICCPDYDGPAAEPGDGVQVIRFANTPLPSYPDVRLSHPSGEKIKKAIEAFGADLIHIQTPGPLGYYGTLAAGYYNLPSIGTYHTLVSEQSTYLSPLRLFGVDSLLDSLVSTNPIAKSLVDLMQQGEELIARPIIEMGCNLFYNSTDLVITPTRTIRTELLKSGVTKPIRVVSNGINLKRFSGTVRERPHSPPALVHTGRLSFEKNCDVLLEAFRIIRQTFPEATLDFIGDGPATASLKKGVPESDERIRFVGTVPYDSLPERYRDYDLFLTASTMETQGLAVLEACATGLPCVGVDSHALPELIQEERNGYIVPPFSPQRMAERAIEILSDAERFGRFSKQSIEIARGHDSHVCAASLEAIYDELVTGKKQSDVSS